MLIESIPIKYRLWEKTEKENFIPAKGSLQEPIRRKA
jgi:hypothetical protein